ncbi:MAG: thioredoxin family protein [Saprospiraceae bacterium]|nr:thioredoxin family protein [Saprospiraceae bacterium]
MKSIKILGTGCAKCKQMDAIVRQVVSEIGMEANIQKVEDIQEIMEYNVLSTPVLVIDEKVTIKGRVPTASEVKALLS